MMVAVRLLRRATRDAVPMLLLPLVLTIGCGRKAPPRAPEDILPVPIADLSGRATSEGIELSWTRPATYTDGTHMTDLGGFIIERASGSDASAPFERLRTLEMNDRERFRQVKHFRFLDTSTTVGMVYRYRVVSFTIDRYFSAPSNLVTVERPVPNEEPHAPLPTTPR